MGDATTCEHDFHWYMAPDEVGWKCVNCDHKPGEPPGYSPHLDAELTGRKVWAVLDDLHNAEIVYVSNGSEGDYLAQKVAARCREASVYDQESIARFLLEHIAADPTYWRELGNAIRGGTDPRRRCKCGKMANSFRGEKASCSEHWTLFDEEGAP